MSAMFAGPARGLTGGKVLAILLAFFGTVGSVNALMIHYALSTFRGEVADHPFEAGLKFNREIAASRSQAARNWRVDAHIISSGAARTLQLTARDSDGRPLSDLSFRAILAAPVDHVLDKGVNLTAQGDGRYIGEIIVAKGHWDLEITGKRSDETLFQSRGRIELE
jgi:nitrogen fixation protein FixH